MGMGTTMDDRALFRLLAWLSPGFPVGAYAYSHGLEWAVEAGDVRDSADLRAWIADVLGHGAGRNDAIFLSQTMSAAAAGDRARLERINELAVASTPSAERRLETTAQGKAFLATAQEAWPWEASEELAFVPTDAIAFPVAVGVVAAGHGIPARPTVHGYLQAFAANLISASLRLIAVGQTEGQCVLAGLETVIAAVADDALAATLDDIGGATVRADIASMRHETQYTRLFRS